jgi:hypothetical protein
MWRFELPTIVEYQIKACMVASSLEKRKSIGQEDDTARFPLFSYTSRMHVIKMLARTVFILVLIYVCFIEFKAVSTSFHSE